MRSTVMKAIRYSWAQHLESKNGTFKVNNHEINTVLNTWAQNGTHEINTQKSTRYSWNEYSCGHYGTHESLLMKLTRYSWGTPHAVNIVLMRSLLMKSTRHSWCQFSWSQHSSHDVTPNEVKKILMRSILMRLPFMRSTKWRDDWPCPRRPGTRTAVSGCCGRRGGWVGGRPLAGATGRP
jgi:hypothetical protein